MKKVRSWFRRRGEAGLTTPELLVAMALAVIVLGGLTAFLVNTMNGTADREERTTALAQLENASGLLMKDISDGIKIAHATPSELTVHRVIEGVCEAHAYRIDDGQLTLEHEIFTGKACTGESETGTVTVVENLSSATPFTYFSARSQSTALTAPVKAEEVRRVAWDLKTITSRTGEPLAVHSAAAFTGNGAASEGSGQIVNALKPLLRITTAHIGVDAPEITWEDSTANAASSWTVYRVSTAEGTTPSTSWETISVIVNQAPTLAEQSLSFTDRTLPAGHTAQYIVRSNPLSGSQGPTSNQISSGLRPAAPAVTITPSIEALRLDWAAILGATRYDIYRDNTLLIVGTPGTSFTDETGLGHAHQYQVVAVNRWEREATANAGTPLAERQSHSPVQGQWGEGVLLGPGDAKAARLLSEVVAGWTAPITPALKKPVNQLPADQANPVLQWVPDIDLAWNEAIWTGAYSPAARAATRYALVRGNEALTTTAGTSYKDTGAPRGVKSIWELTATAGILTGATTRAELLTWPSAPSCTVTAGAPATSRLSVSIATGAGQTVTERRSRLVTVGARPGGTTYASTPRAMNYLQTSAGDSHTVTNLSPGTSHSFRSQARNGAGYGPFGGTCSRNTAALTASITTGSSTTKALTATVTATGGSTRRVEVLQGSAVKQSWASAGTKTTTTALKHDTDHTWRATNGDGFATYTATRGHKTVLLRKPTISSLTQTTHSLAATPTVSNQTGSTTLQLRIGSGSWATGRQTYTGLKTGTHSLRARSYDGFNEVLSDTRNVALSAPAIPGCTTRLTKATSLGTLEVRASGSTGTYQSRLGSTTKNGATTTYSSLSTGTYRAQVRAIDAAQNYSSWSASGVCAARTVTPPPPPPFSPSPWSGSAPSCPIPLWYVTPGAPATWQVRRATVTTCQTRVVLTEAGALATGLPYGSVIGMYQYVIGSGAAAWTPVSGDAFTRSLAAVWY